MRKTLLALALLLVSSLLVALPSLQATAQEHRVTGKVTGQDGSPLPGITIQVKGTSSGTATDADGQYELTAPDNATLTFRGIGFTEQNVNVGSRSEVNITMQSSTQQLNELVVTALGRGESKEKIGYATQTFTSSQINQNAPANMLSNLAGKIAGADISQQGGPGSSTKVVLRGYGVIAGGNNQPLYVIDGAPLADNRPGANDNGTSGVDFGNGMAMVNPSDIKSITVLKGTAATALYGSAAKNGAIMITTKRGQEGAIKVSYVGSVELSQVGRLPKLQDEFGTGWGFQYIPDENGSWGPRLDGKMRPWGSIVDNSQLVKPFSAIKDNMRSFYTTGVAVTNSLAVSGGGTHNQFYFSYDNVSNNGVIPTRSDYLQRNNFSLRTNSNYGKFSINTSFNYINRMMRAPNTGQNTPSGGGVFESLLQIPVDIPIDNFQLYNNKFFNINNYFTPYAENPYFGLNENGDKQNSDRFFGNLDLKYQFTNEFSAQLRLGGDFEDARTFSWNQVASAQPGYWNGVTNPTNPEGSSKTPDLGSVEKLQQYYGTINSDFILEYNKTFNSDYSLDVIGGANFYQNAYDETDAMITNLVIPGFYNLSNSIQPPTATESRQLRRRMGLYGQAVLGYKNQVFITGNVRNDWSSTLPINSNAIFYPGANISWVASNTFNMSDAISHLKLRAAYGKTGSDPNPYQTYPVLNAANISLGFGSMTSPFNGVPAFGVSNTINNSKLKPIMTTELETGIDAGFLNERITLDLSLYNKITDGQIFPVSIDPSTGYTLLVENLGKVRNQGIEITLNVIPVQTNNFEWSFDYTFAKNDNKVLNLNGGLPNPLLNSAYSAELRAVVGKTVAEIYAPTPQLSPNGQIVVSPVTGFPLVNATPNTKDYNSTNRDYGTALYDYTMGFSNTLRYKDLSLNFSLDFRYGGVMYSETADLLNFVGNAYNTTYNDRKPFIVPNSVVATTDASGKTVYAENTVPIPAEDYYDYFYPTKNPALAYNARIFNRSFLKLRNVSLSYSLPQQLTKRIRLNNISVSIYAKNILLWTPASNYTVDPEATNFGNDLTGELGEFAAAPLEQQYGLTLGVTF